MKFNVHILLYSEDDIQIAHCLEFDLVAQGKRKIEALRNLMDAIDLQISFALENNDLASIFTPAPAEYWKMLLGNYTEYIDSFLKACDKVAEQIDGEFDSAEDLRQIRNERTGSL